MIDMPFKIWAFIHQSTDSNGWHRDGCTRKSCTKYTNTTALIEWLEGQKMSDSPAPSVVAPRFNHPSTPSNEEYYAMVHYNAAIQTVIARLKGDE